jgi:hypothetical protein
MAAALWAFVAPLDVVPVAVVVECLVCVLAGLALKAFLDRS